MAKKTTKKKTTKKAAPKPARSTSKKTTKKITKKTTKKTTKKVTKAPAKKSAKKSVTKKPAPKKSAPKKPVTKKPAAKKKVTKKPVKKASSTKSNAKKTTTKKTTKKPSSTAVKKPVTKKTVTTKSAAKKTTTKITTTKKPATTTKKTSKKTTAKGTPDAMPAVGAAKPAEKRPNRRRSSKPKVALVFPTRPMLGSLKNMKPLIASGASAKKQESILDGATPKKIKSPFNKRQLDGYKLILLAKRNELLGDIQHLEEEALKGGSGDSAHTTNHISEQGSDNYDQALNLNLAAADRKMLAEIDEALQRIVDRTYGACMITGEPIKKARLDEIPWAKYSIKAAQELDRRGY